MVWCGFFSVTKGVVKVMCDEGGVRMVGYE